MLSEVNTEAENAPGAHPGLGKPGLRGSSSKVWPFVSWAGRGGRDVHRLGIFSKGGIGSPDPRCSSHHLVSRVASGHHPAPLWEERWMLFRVWWEGKDGGSTEALRSHAPAYLLCWSVISGG